MDRLITNEVYRFLFENSFDAILLTHPDGSIYRANPAACEMFQWNEEEICQLGRSGLVDVNDPRLEAVLKERAAKGKIRTELNFRRKNGTVFPTESTSALFKDEEGILWTVIIVRDMSLIKTTEELLRKAKEELAYYATYDDLTGTFNRRAFVERLQQEMERSKREITSLSLILLDIDHFKEVNDSMGHNCGDEILKKIAVSLAEKLRPYDFLGRYGGDEFIICLPNTTVTEAFEVAERLREKIETSIMICKREHISVTISLGLACHSSRSNEDSNDLIGRADRNLYTAKLKRNCIYGK